MLKSCSRFWTSQPPEEAVTWLLCTVCKSVGQILKPVIAFLSSWIQSHKIGTPSMTQCIIHAATCGRRATVTTLTSRLNTASQTVLESLTATQEYILWMISAFFAVPGCASCARRLLSLRQVNSGSEVLPTPLRCLRGNVALYIGFDADADQLYNFGLACGRLDVATQPRRNSRAQPHRVTVDTCLLIS